MRNRTLELRDDGGQAAGLSQLGLALAGIRGPSPKFFPSGKGSAPARLDGLLSTSARIISD